MVIRLIVASTRAARVGRTIADAIAPVIAEGAGVDVDIVDLKEINLPLMDEPKMPGLGDYQLETTKAWAKMVTESDAVIFLTPEYNGSFTPACKNAIDTVFAEWEGKRAGVIGYGYGGGSRVVPMLAQIMTLVKMDVVEGSVQMPFGDALTEDGLDVTALIDGHKDALKALGQQLVAQA